MVIDGDGELLFGGVLTDDVLIQILRQFQWLRELVGGRVLLIVTVVLENRIADGNAFVTNVSLGIVGERGDQLPDNILAFVAEGATQSIIRASALHWDLLTDPTKV